MAHGNVNVEESVAAPYLMAANEQAMGLARSTNTTRPVLLDLGRDHFASLPGDLWHRLLGYLHCSSMACALKKGGRTGRGIVTGNP